VDRGKPGSKIHAVSDRNGLPLTVLVSAANVNDNTALEDVLDNLRAIRQPLGRPRRWPAKLHGDKATTGEYAALVRRLGCLRGVSTLTAFGLAVEIGDWHRFTGATIGAYLGLVPTESSSGQQRCQGSITKAGNTHARRLLVEAAWHHRRDYRNAGAAMRARWSIASPAATARGNAGNHRLHQRWQNFVARKRRRSSPTSPSLVNWPAGAGPWRSSTTNRTQCPMNSQAVPLRRHPHQRADRRDAQCRGAGNGHYR
jgi:hypothetical protein